MFLGFGECFLDVGAGFGARAFVALQPLGNGGRSERSRKSDDAATIDDRCRHVVEDNVLNQDRTGKEVGLGGGRLEENWGVGNCGIEN